MKILFYGAGEFGLPTLRYLHEHFEVVGVVSQPDRPAGRKRKLTPTGISQWAIDQDVPLLRTDNANDTEFIQEIKSFGAAIGVVVAFGQKLSPELIGASGNLVVNLHSSLLPKYRGAAPINWAMINDDADTGVSVIELAQRMDAGQIYGMAELAIDPLETAGELHDRLADLGPVVVGRVIEDFQNDQLKGIIQDETLTCRAPKFKKEDGVVDFEKNARSIRCLIHGMTPWPGAKVSWSKQQCETKGEAKVLKLLRVQEDETRDHAGACGVMLDDRHVGCGDGSVLELLEVQAPGGKPLKMDDFLRGNTLVAGDILN